jgi:prepilin-type N-terminal cleavage/methylation domain-containing protein
MRKKGFTLIEVVVSVIIVTALAGIAATSYTTQKRRSEYNGMRGSVMALMAAAKNQYYTRCGLPGITFTANTLATNTQYQMGIRDGNFWNYRVVAVVGEPFDISVQYAPRGTLGDFTVTGTYTFDSSGTQIACVGADCMTP